MDFSITLNDVLSIGIVGAGLSYLIQFLKKKYGMDSLTTKGIIVGLSLLLGGGFYFLRDTEFLVAAFGVLSFATIVWAFLIRSGSQPVEKSADDQ